MPPCCGLSRKDVYEACAEKPAFFTNYLGLNLEDFEELHTLVEVGLQGAGGGRPRSLPTWDISRRMWECISALHRAMEGEIKWPDATEQAELEGTLFDW